MQEHIYIAGKSRIIKQSAFIWLFVALQVVANFMAVPTLLQKEQIWGIILINLVLGLVTTPAIILFVKYYRQSLDKKFVVSYDSLKFVDNKTGKITKLITK